MITVLLCVAFGSLTFKGLTLPLLFGWFCGHPFLFLVAVWELIHGFGRLSLSYKG